MTQPVVFVFNGPRRVGKDTAAEAVVAFAKRPDWLIRPLAYQMKRETLAHFKLDLALLDFYETVKETPLAEFGGMTFREAIIFYGDLMRAQEGESYFGDRWVDEVQGEIDCGLASAILMPDCRFQRDLDAALALSPFTLLYRVYRTPKLHNDLDAWTGDIGSWLFPPVADVAQVSLINDGDIGDIRWTAFATAFHYFEQIQKRHAAAAV